MRAFSSVVAVRPDADGSGPGSRYHVDVHPDWSIGGKPNGGYLLALLGRAVVAAGPHPHLLAASAHYLRPPEFGPAVAEVQTLRAGRTTSQLRARLLQSGTACVEALLTTSRLDPADPPVWDEGVPDPGATSAEQGIRLPGRTPAGVPVPIMEQVDLRLDPDSLGFTTGRPSGRGELRGWLALPEGESFNPVSLLFALDALPPATFDIELSGWVPTLALTAYVRALPAPGPVRILQRAHLVADSRVDETCWVWDCRGQVIAHGSQLAGIRLGRRQAQ